MYVPKGKRSAPLTPLQIRPCLQSALLVSLSCAFLRGALCTCNNRIISLISLRLFSRVDGSHWYKCKWLHSIILHALSVCCLNDSLALIPYPLCSKCAAFSESIAAFTQCASLPVRTMSNGCSFQMGASRYDQPYTTSGERWDEICWQY